MVATRWTQDGLDAQLKPLWRDQAKRAGLELKWHARKEYDEVVQTGARVYLRALKSSEETSKYGKLAGLTLAVIWIDQAEEVEEDVYHAYIPARLSQPGYPHEAILTPNPPALDHWLAKEFPESDPKPDHLYIRTTVYDNRANLPPEYISSLELEYPLGHALRRRFIEGRRGLSVIGEPVYGRVFNRRTHVQEIEANPDLPLVESWDFGHKHPAVVWCQFTPWGTLHILGELMGNSEFIESFAPRAVEQREAWFGNVPDVWPAAIQLEPSTTARAPSILPLIFSKTTVCIPVTSMARIRRRSETSASNRSAAT